MVQSVKCVTVLPPVSQKDHLTIIIECLFRVTTGHACERIMWNYDKSNFDTYCDNLNKIILYNVFKPTQLMQFVNHGMKK